MSFSRRILTHRNVLQEIKKITLSQLEIQLEVMGSSLLIGPDIHTSLFFPLVIELCSFQWTGSHPSETAFSQPLLKLGTYPYVLANERCEEGRWGIAGPCLCFSIPTSSWHEWRLNGRIWSCQLRSWDGSYIWKFPDNWSKHVRSLGLWSHRVRLGLMTLKPVGWQKHKQLFKALLFSSLWYKSWIPMLLWVIITVLKFLIQW